MYILLYTYLVVNFSSYALMCIRISIIFSHCYFKKSDWNIDIVSLAMGSVKEVSWKFLKVRKWEDKQ